mgnify:CR=1 FL=1
MLQKTNHCNYRTSQRAIDDKKISIIVTHGKSVYHKEHLLYYLLTKDISRLLKQGFIQKQECEKIRNIIVVSSPTGELVTVYHMSKRKRKKVMKIY